MDTEKLIIPSMTGSSNDGLLGGGGIGALLIGALLFGGGLGGFGGRGGLGGPAAAAVATDITLNPAFQSIQNQIQTLSGTVNQNAISGQIGETNESINSGFRDLAGSLASIGRDYNQLFGQVNSNIATGNFTTLSSINGLGRDVTAQANQNALQQLNSFNVLTTTTLQGVNSLAMQNITATNQIISQGTALASQLAACCCDIQQKISSDGDETRALINSINLQSLQAQLNDAKNQISNFNQTQVILNSLSPRAALTTVV